MRFTIRDVLWLMVVVGLACALWIEAGRRTELAKKITVLEQILDRSQLRVDWKDDGAKLFGKYKEQGVLLWDSKADPNGRPMVRNVWP